MLKTDSVTKEDAVGMRELGRDPESGKPIFVRMGRFGPYVQKGSKDDEEKPTFASIKKGQNMDEITLADALTLFSLPRVVGKDEDGFEIVVNRGRFGPYATVNSKNYSLKNEDPFEVTLERVLEIIKGLKEVEAAKNIKKFTGSEIKVLNGKYGPYITDGQKNAKIPKDSKPEDLTLEECQDLIAKAPAKRGRRT